MVQRGPHAPAGAPASTRVSWRRRVHVWVADHQASVWTVGAISVVAVAWQRVNLGTAPRPASGEGALVAAGWSIVHLGSAGDATFSSAGPSLAPVHLGAWMWATGALGRASSAIAAGREAMLAAHIISIPLVWALARRSGLARWAAGAAAVVFAASPLAVGLQRPVHGAGLAVPWMLAALVLATAATAPGADGRHRRLVPGGGRADRAQRGRGGPGGRLAAVALVPEPPSPAPPPPRGRGCVRRRVALGDRPRDVGSAAARRVARSARPDSSGRGRCVLGDADRGRRARRAIRCRPDGAGSRRGRRLPAGGGGRAVGGAPPPPDRLRLLGVCRPHAGLRRALVDHCRRDGAVGRGTAGRRCATRLGLARRSPSRAPRADARRLTGRQPARRRGADRVRDRRRRHGARGARLGFDSPRPGGGRPGSTVGFRLRLGGGQPGPW